MKILFIVGSLRKDSFNGLLAKNLAKIAAKNGIETELTDVNLPIFNQDEYKTPDSRVTSFREKITSADGVIIVSPEYNRSIPGPVKNALDWTAWQVENFWKDKRTALAGATPSMLGTALAQTDLRKVLNFVGAKIMAQPELFVAFAAKQFDQDGNVSPEEEAFLTNWVESFAKFIAEK